MGLFDSLTNKSSETEESDNWETITDISEIDPLIERSKDRPQLIYKHSNRCSVCFVAKGNLEKGSETILQHADMHYLDVVKNRDVSNSIASDLDVRHESPQAIVVEDGEVIWHASHGGIDSEKIIEVFK